MKRQTLFAALATIILALTWLYAETDYQVGQGVERVITRRLQVQGNNARVIIKGATEITGNVTQTGDLDITGDVDITGGMSASANVSGANVTTTGKVSGSVVAFTSATGGTVTATGTITAAGRIAAQSASSGEMRVGYLTSDGWVMTTIGGGTTLIFQNDYATTGGVTYLSISDSGVLNATTLQGSLAGTYISGTLYASMPVSATYSTATNGAITVQAKDPAGSNLARAIGFEFWFSTSSVVTTPSTNEIESFSVQNGDMRMYREISSAVPTYIAQTDNTGKFLVNTVVYTNGTSSLTNYFHLLGPNGYYTNFQCKYNP